MSTVKPLMLSCMALACMLSTGCSSVGGKSFRDWLPGKKPPKPETPIRMAVMWTPDILAGVGKTPTRGFGGRVFFYNDRGKPVMVDGDLVIHGFDELQDSNNPSNARRYKFNADQLATHYSESNIGGSYSFWMPWDALGTTQRRITLIVTFQPRDGGRPVQGEAATVLLPGPSAKGPENALPPQPVIPASANSYQGAPQQASSMQTTTIRR